MKYAKILRNNEATWGIANGNDIVLADGTRMKTNEANFLAPVQPTKIIACHLSPTKPHYSPIHGG